MPETPKPPPTEFNNGPTRTIPGDERDSVKDALGVCLSGGGYRAMLFHLGTLWRLNEFGLLPKISRLSSVSGGSITAAALGLAWKRLTFDNGIATNFKKEVADPIHHLGQKTIDAPAIIGGVLLPFVTVSDLLVWLYNKHLLHGASMQDLPDASQPNTPEFLFNSTSLQSLVLWRFTRRYMRDWRVGTVPNPTVDLAVAVAASSAFPPVLSPLRLKFKEGEILPMEGTDLHQPPYTTKVMLTDGGVYDNLGLETVWKSHRQVLVSDAGGKMSPEPTPKAGWIPMTYQVLSMGDNQVRNLRKRQVVGSFTDKSRLGAYWSIRSDPTDFPYHSPLPIDPKIIDELANTTTRLAKLPVQHLERLVNWGYAMCDIACQSWFKEKLPTAPPAAFPYPQNPI